MRVYGRRTVAPIHKLFSFRLDLPFRREGKISDARLPLSLEKENFLRFFFFFYPDLMEFPCQRHLCIVLQKYAAYLSFPSVKGDKETGHFFPFSIDRAFPHLFPFSVRSRKHSSNCSASQSIPGEEIAHSNLIL